MKRLGKIGLFALFLVGCSLTGTSSIATQDSLDQLEQIVDQEPGYGKFDDGSDGIGFTCTIFEGAACYLTADLERLRTQALGSEVDFRLETNFSRQLVQDLRVEYLDGSRDDSVAVLCMKPENQSSYTCRSTQSSGEPWDEWDDLPIK